MAEPPRPRAPRLSKQPIPGPRPDPIGSLATAVTVRIAVNGQYDVAGGLIFRPARGGGARQAGPMPGPTSRGQQPEVRKRVGPWQPDRADSDHCVGTLVPSPGQRPAPGVAAGAAATALRVTRTQFPRTPSPPGLIRLVIEHTHVTTSAEVPWATHPSHPVRGR